MEKVCFSCGVPLNGEFLGKAENYCAYCTDDNGELKSREETLVGLAGWLKGWQPDIDDATAMKRAEHYMQAMPAWAND